MRQLLLKIFLFPFAVGLSFIFLSGCEKKYDTVVDSVGNAPVVSDARFSLSVVNTDTINIGTERRPDDQLTIRGVASVRVVHSEGIKEIRTIGYSVVKTLSSSSNGEGILHDDGVPPDQSTNDSIYSGFVDFRINRVDVGEYWITFWSENRSGYIHSQDRHYQSNMALLPLQIFRLNHPPVLSNLEMDSLVSIGGDDHVLQLRVMATDSDGQSDILKVYFNSFKPDRSPSSGNPHLMYDDGNSNTISGDQVAGDGIYGLKVSLPKTTTIGIYQFEFHATDRSLDSSNLILRNIVVTN